MLYYFKQGVLFKKFYLIFALKRYTFYSAGVPRKFGFSYNGSTLLHCQASACSRTDLRFIQFSTNHSWRNSCEGVKHLQHCSCPSNTGVHLFIHSFVHSFIHLFVFVDPLLVLNHRIQKLSILQRSKYQIELLLLQ